MTARTFSMISLERYSRVLTTPQFILLNLTLGIGHFMVLLNAGAYLPMLPYISGTTGVNFPYAVWGQCDYFTGMSAAFLITRALMKRYGPKYVAILSYILFAVSSLIALFIIPFYSVYIANRVVQGFSAGISIISSFFLLLEYYKEEQQKTANALWSLALFVPYSIGPALGGWLAYVMGDWRLLFIISFPIALFVACMLWALLADWEDEVDSSYPIGHTLQMFFLFFVAAISLQEFFDVGLLIDLTSRYKEHWWLLFAFVISLFLFMEKNHSSNAPLIRPSIFSHPNYAYGMLILCLGFMVFQSAIVQYVLRIQFVEGYTAWHAGLLFLPIFVFSKPLSVLSQHLIHKGNDPRLLASISFLAFSVCFWWISGYSRPATWETLLWPQFLMGAALGLLFVSMTATALSHVPKPDQVHAVDVLNTVRNLAAGLAITFSDIGWSHLFDHEHNLLTTQGVSNPGRFASTFDVPSAIHLLHEKIDLQSSYMTFNDLFHLLSILSIALAALIWLAHAPSKKVLDRDMDLLENFGEEP